MVAMEAEQIFVCTRNFIHTLALSDRSLATAPIHNERASSEHGIADFTTSHEKEFVIDLAILLRILIVYA